MHHIALTIAGSDPSGGAGIQADLKTFHQKEVYGMSVITLITIQNTHGIEDIIYLQNKHILSQLKCVLKDIIPHAIKIGAMGKGKYIEQLANMLSPINIPIVIDPILKSKNGKRLMTKKALNKLKKHLIPISTLITPNIEEAKDLSGIDIKDIKSMEHAAKNISKLGGESVLITGGIFNNEVIDLLYINKKVVLFNAPYIDTYPRHGTGCTLSAAITAELSKGADIYSSIKKAKDFITKAIQQGLDIGQKYQPLNHNV